MVEMPRLMEDGETKLCTVWRVVTKNSWQILPNGKSRRKRVFNGLELKEDKLEVPLGAPITPWLFAGKVRMLKMVGIPRGMKYLAFEWIAKAFHAYGMICLIPDFKESEPRLVYGFPEDLASLFGVRVSYFYASSSKWGKWLRYVMTPTKVEVSEPVTCLYLETPDDENGYPVNDGGGVFFGQWDILKESGKMLWNGFSNFVQIRHTPPTPEVSTECMIAIKACIASDGHSVAQTAREVLLSIGQNPITLGSVLVLNQHAVKYNGGPALKHGQMWKQQVRLIGIKVRAKGSSTVSGQEVSQNPDSIRELLYHHGLSEAAHFMVAYTQGTPYAIIDGAKGFETVDTNQFLTLLYMVRRNGKWLRNRMPSFHRRHLAFCESLYRNTIIATKINNRSAYQYHDPRCDAAMLKHYRETGEWRLIVVPEEGTPLDSLGRLIYIKAPNHSRPCLVTAYCLTEEVDSVRGGAKTQEYVFCPEGGFGLPNLMAIKVKGLDFDGDKAGFGEHPDYMPELAISFSDCIVPKSVVPKANTVKPSTLEEAQVAALEGARVASNATFAIGYVSLTLRYCIMWCNLNGVTISDEAMMEIGNAQEEGIQAGAKTVLKSGAASVVIDCSTATEDPEGLIESCFVFFEHLVGVTVPRMSGWGELDKSNLAEICHTLMNKGGGSKIREHAAIYSHRVKNVIPLYKAHPASKAGFARGFAFNILANADMAPYLEPVKADCGIFQNEYAAVWKMIQAGFKAYTPEDLGYEFTLEKVVQFGDWLTWLYRNKSGEFLRSFRGSIDETGAISGGNWDKDLKTERFQRLNRALRFFFCGIAPHGYDLEKINIELSSHWEKFALIKRDKNHQWFKFQCFVLAYLGSKEFNTKGKEGNSGGVCMRIPSSVHCAVKRMYYTKTAAGIAEVEKGLANPFVDLCETLAEKFEEHQLELDLKWLADHPFEIRKEKTDSDEEGFEVDSLASEYYDED